MTVPSSFFETARLTARPFGEADLEPFVAYRADPDVERFQSWSDYTLEHGRGLISSMRQASPGAPGQWYQVALEHRDSGVLIGDLACKRDEVEPSEMEVGFTIAPAHQGKGYAAEALRGLLDFTFDAFSLHRVIAVTDALNAPAAALLDSVGMRREAHFVENVFFKGQWGSELLFAILEREWRQVGEQANGEAAAAASP